MTGLKAAICSVGVVVMWLFCVVASLVPLQMLIGAFRSGDVGQAWFAVVVGIAILALAWWYPRYLARFYEKTTGKRAWFAPRAG